MRARRTNRKVQSELTTLGINSQPSLSFMGPSSLSPYKQLLLRTAHSRRRKEGHLSTGFCCSLANDSSRLQELSLSQSCRDRLWAILRHLWALEARKILRAGNGGCLVWTSGEAPAESSWNPWTGPWCHLCQAHRRQNWKAPKSRRRLAPGTELAHETPPTMRPHPQRDPS